MKDLILFGAGACGGYVLRDMRAKGFEPLAMADNDSSKWGATIPGAMCRDGISDIDIISPQEAQDRFPEAKWVATAISRPAALEIRTEIRKRGVTAVPLWEVLECNHGLPSQSVGIEIRRLTEDALSTRMVNDQLGFRRVPDYDAQERPDPISEIYFPNFITHRDDEHFVDCGAADGDTMKQFMARWSKWDSITAYEPDRKNWDKLYKEFEGTLNTYGRLAAVSDVPGLRSFIETGDYASHFGDGEWKTACVRLDDENYFTSPTYIKMDIEGAELEAIWGARRIIKEHSPVLAITAYHTSDHFWQIPLLIHAINPDYKLFFRRYAEGAWEIVWYAVPPDRVAAPWSNESYSDNHSG